MTAIAQTGVQSNPTLRQWNRLRRLPFGRSLFSRLIGFVVPYSGSISAEVLALEAGHARVRVHDRRRLRNHLRSLHAVALINLAEMTGNFAMMTQQPAKGARWIVTGMDAEFLKKARGAVTASCDLAPLDWRKDSAVEGRVELRDGKGDLVMVAKPRWKIGPAAQAANAATGAR